MQSVDGRRAAGEAAVARVAAAGRAVSLMLRSAPRGAVRRACVLGVLPSHAYAVAIPSPYLAVPLCRRGVMCTRYPPGCGVSTVWLPVGRVRDGRAGAVRGVCGHVVGLQGCRGAPVPAPPPPPSSPVCGGGGGGGGDVGARGWALRRRRGVGLRVCVTRGGCGGCEGLGGSHGGAWRVYAAPPLACAGGCNTTIWAGPLLVTPTVPRRRAQHGRSGAHGGEAHPLLPPPIFTNGTGENPGAEGGGGWCGARTHPHLPYRAPVRRDDDGWRPTRTPSTHKGDTHTNVRTCSVQQPPLGSGRRIKPRGRLAGCLRMSTAVRPCPRVGALARPTHTRPWRRRPTRRCGWCPPAQPRQQSIARAPPPPMQTGLPAGCSIGAGTIKTQDGGVGGTSRSRPASSVTWIQVHNLSRNEIIAVAVPLDTLPVRVAASGWPPPPAPCGGPRP